MKQNSKTLGVASVLVILSVLSIGVVWLLTGDKKGGGKAMGYVQKAPQLNGKADFAFKDEIGLFEANGRVTSAPSQASEKNQAMDRLMAGRDMAPEDFSALMRRLHADGAQDELTRNFAVQHLGLYVQRRIRLGEYNPDSREALEIRSTLETAADETHSTVAGPAFKALAELAAVDPAVVEGGLDARLVACAGDASANVPTRVIAVQFCGARRLAAARPALEAILSDPKSGTVLKLAARRALRHLPADLTFRGNIPRHRKLKWRGRRFPEVQNFVRNIISFADCGPYSGRGWLSEPPGWRLYQAAGRKLSRLSGIGEIRRTLEKF